MRRLFPVWMAVFFLILQSPRIAPAEEEAVELGPVVVTATKTEVPLHQMTRSVTVVTEAEIVNKQATTVEEVLRDVAGLDVVQYGGPGGLTSVFIRGGDSKQTLVLVDGVQVNSQIFGQFDFSSLTVDNIERIEVVRGSQSTLYGADAVAGVIQIFTKHGTGKRKTAIQGEAGSYRSGRVSAAESGGSSDADYSVAISHSDAEGISRANEKDGNPEPDGYRNTTFSTRMGGNIGGKKRVEFTGRYTAAAADLDDSIADDPNFTQKTKSLMLSALVKEYSVPRWYQEIRLGFHRDEQIGKDPDPGDVNYEFNTQRRQVEWRNTVSVNPFDQVTFGYEFEAQDVDNQGYYEKSISGSSLYFQDQHRSSDRFHQVFGIRKDYNSRYEDVTTYRAEAAYEFMGGGPTLRASYGTGFQSPLLGELYDPSYGNPNLEAMKSRSFEAGLEQFLASQKVRFDAAYFHDFYNDLIVSAPPTYLPYNIGVARSQGVEVGVRYHPGPRVSVNLNYTLTHARDEDSHQALPRRPRHKANATLFLKPSEAQVLQVNVNYVGSRFDDPANLQPLADHTVVQASWSYDWSERTRLFARVENLFNREYEEVLGYGTPGRSYYGGLKLTF